MPKRGEKLPWRIRFEWSNGVKGTRRAHTKEDAEMFADHIRANAATTTRATLVRLVVDEPPR